MAEIESIVIQHAPSEYKEPYRFNRVPIQAGNLIADHGLEGDLKAGRARNRQLNILARGMLDEMAVLGYKTGPGEIGEQLIVNGINVMELERGTRLQLGPEAIIEITITRTPCDWFAQVQGQKADRQLGVMARVVHGGPIRVGDAVRVMEGVSEEP